MSIDQFGKYSVFTVNINKINIELACKHLMDVEISESKYILFPDLSVISLATQDNHLKMILNQAYLTMPDGKPSQFIARLKGYDEVRTVSGYKLIEKLLRDSSKTHYFYGSTKEKLSKIKSNLSQYDPDGTKILGYKEPPFLKLHEIPASSEIRDDLKNINHLNPDFIWVGLSSPKQDYLLYHHHDVIDKGFLLGVGGVFDYLSGDVNISPEWIKRIGLRWLYRLINEPVRLTPKYSKIVINFAKYYLKRNSD